MKKNNLLQLCVLLTAIFFVLLTTTVQTAATRRTNNALYTSPHVRFGAVMAGHERNKITALDVERIHLGWQVEHESQTFDAHSFAIQDFFVVHLSPYSFDYDSFEIGRAHV